MPTTRPNQRLKSERELRGWSQAYLAKQIGAPHNYYISRWERGEMIPSPHYQQKLCELFGKTAEELGFLTPEENEAAPLARVADLPAPSEVSAIEPLPLELPSSELPSSEYPSLEPPSLKPPPTPILPFWKRHARPLIVVLVLLLLGSVGGWVGLQYMQMHTTSIVGTFSFASSGIDSMTDSQGMADEVLINMTLDGPPTAGTAYYAWLMPDQDKPEGNIVQLGQVMLHGTSGTLFYPDPTHTNLLLAHGSLWITEQPVSPFPQSPLPEDERYQAMIPQIPDSGKPTPYSLLDHLRHLLAKDPELDSYQLSGGLAVWMVNNTKLLASWAMDAQKAWQQNQTDAFHQDLLYMIDYLDGLNMVPKDQNLPAEQQLIATNFNSDQHQWGQLGLLDVQPSQSTDTEGYMPHIQSHLQGILRSPGVTDQQQDLANQLITATSTLTDQLIATRLDLYTLLKEPSQNSQQLQDLTASTSSAEKGAQQVATQMLQLLRFPITNK